MGRFFDILHNNPIPEDTRRVVTGQPEDNARPQDARRLLDALPEGLQGVESIKCRVRPEDRIVGCSQNHNLGAEKFRFLRYRLNELRRQRPVAAVLITSSIPREGKTVVAINLAVSLAQSSGRVALVDADMRQPGVHRALGLGSLPGLAEFLEEKIELRGTLRRLDPFGLYYLPAGRASRNPCELLQNPRLRKLMTLATSAFEWMIFDSPPLVPFADAQCLATLTDTTMVVVRPGFTPREIMQQGLNNLGGASVAGVVLNASDDTRQDQYYYHYYSSASDENRQNGQSEATTPIPGKGLSDD